MSQGNNIVLFALSTCNACKKTKELLKRYDIEYMSVDLDTVDVQSRNRLLKKMKRYNPRETFPTLVINAGEKVVVGYSENEMKKSLHLQEDSN